MADSKSPSEATLERRRAHSRAWARAYQVVARRHPEELREAVEHEKARLGIRTLQPRSSQGNGQ